MASASRIMLLGQVLHREILTPRIVNVRVIQQVYDSHLHMFFPEPKDFKVLENQEVKVNPGDIIRILQLPEKFSVEVDHEAVEVIYPVGRTIDPVTGRRCRGTKFIDEKAREEEVKRVASAKSVQNYPL